MLTCNYLILGAGETGLRLAKGLVATGKKVYLVAENFGGKFVNTAEIPTNYLVEQAKNFALGLEYYKNYPETFAVLRKRRQRIKQDLQKHIDGVLETNLQFFEKHKDKITFISGKASFFSKSILEVDSNGERELIKFDHCLIATGKSIYRQPKIKGLDKSRMLSLDEAFLLKEIPSKLVVYGISKQSLQLAIVYAFLGVKVVVLEKSSVEQILPEVDRTAFNYILQELSKRQVEFLFNQKIVEASTLTKSFSLKLSTGNEVKGSHIFIDGQYDFSGKKINLEKVNLKYTDSGLETNSFGTTKNSKIYAFGQANQNPKKQEFNYLSQELGGNKTILKILQGALSQESGVISKSFRLDLLQPVICYGLCESAATKSHGSVVVSKIFYHQLYEGLVKIIYFNTSKNIIGAVVLNKVATMLDLYLQQEVASKSKIYKVEQFLEVNGYYPKI